MMDFIKSLLSKKREELKRENLTMSYELPKREEVFESKVDKEKLQQKLHDNYERNKELYEASKKKENPTVKRTSSSTITYLKGKKAVQKSFVVFDIETTGLSPHDDEIIEIGAIRVDDINASSHTTYQELIKPSCRISSRITSITGITNDMLENCNSIDHHIKEFKEFIGDLPIVAHNASFDCGFMSHTFKKHGLEFNNHVIDTLQLSRKALPQLENHKLTTIKKHLCIKSDRDHRALDDAIATLRVYAFSIDELYNVFKK